MPVYFVTSSARRRRIVANSKEDAISRAREKGIKGPLKVRRRPQKAKRPRLIYNDGGLQGSGHGKESNDCTVRALAISLGIRYDSAHRLLEVYGRQDGQCYQFYRWICGVGQHLFNQVEQQKLITVATFLKQHQAGVFICGMAGHIFTIVNGAIHDTWYKPKARSRIKGIWTPIKLA